MLSATITTVLLLGFGITGGVFGAAGLGFGSAAAVGLTGEMSFGFAAAVGSTAGFGFGPTAVGFANSLGWLMPKPTTWALALAGLILGGYAPRAFAIFSFASASIA